MSRNLLLLPALLLCILGCSQQGPNIGTVSGVITLNGEPLPNATIKFMPVVEGRSSVGASDTSGNYQLVFTMREMGALVGDHDVSISTTGVDGSGKNVPDKVPAKFRKPGALTASVQPGKNTIDFHLK